ncbi:GGT5 hydrolase, partial [Amia calva]|nr:GGT5 hydrolase [Amia calva]
RDILKEGGSAVDGAIAALLCTSLINPQSMGIGGGAIFTVFEKTGKVKVINARETVPNIFQADLMKDCPMGSPLITGSKWIAVPGEIRGYEKAHKMYGKLPWKRLFEPTIKLARDGFKVPQILSRYLQFPMIKGKVEGSSLCALFCDENNKTLKEGDTLRYEKLADTLEAIANSGPDAFYKGKLADDLITDVQNEGGTLSTADLESMQAEVSDAWTVQLGTYTMYLPQPPAGGTILSIILNIMKGYNLNPSSLEGDNKFLTYHRYIEALKFANGQKRKVWDPVKKLFLVVFLKAVAERLIKDDFAAYVRSLISSNQTHPRQYYNVSISRDGVGTTHISVLAEDGTAVSVTSTINQLFGSMVYSPSTGVILNNELADFCGLVDSISTGEKPPSSMTPVVLYSKSEKKTLVIGGSGGFMITSSVAMAIMNHLWFGKDLKEAISAKVVTVNSTNGVNFEHMFDQTVIDKMKDMGHGVGTMKYALNVVNGIFKQDSCITAVSDARKNGEAAGY